MPFLTVRGVDHYFEWITAEGCDRAIDSTKPVMVFLHGWGGSTHYWISTARSLSPDFDCLLYDLRGFGRSRLPRPRPAAQGETHGETYYQLVTYAEDLALLLDGLGLSKIYINGHSVGGSVVLQFLVGWGERVERAILTCSGVFEYNQVAFKIFQQMSRAVVGFRPGWLVDLSTGDRSWHRFAQRCLMSMFVHQPLTAEMNRTFLADYLMADVEASRGTISALLSQQAAMELPQAFMQLTVPTLLVSGQQDQIIPVALGKAAARLNDRIAQVVVDQAAHFPMLEQPGQYLKVVRGFLLSGKPEAILD